METYHKIQTLFKRHLDGPKKGKMIQGAWTTPELEYLAGNEWEFTEKVDGTNIRISLNRVGDTIFADYAGRTDNAVLPKPLLAHLEATFPTYPLNRRDLRNPSFLDRYDEVRSWMVDNDLGDVILFGEGYGPKIQNGGNYRDDQSFVLFDVKIGDFWLKRDAVNDVAKNLGIDSVPVIGRGTLQDAIDIVSTGLTWDRNGKMTNWGGFDKNSKRNFNGLKSQWGDFEAEGIVARPVVDLFDRAGNRIITKIKAVDFR